MVKTKQLLPKQISVTYKSKVKTMLLKSWWSSKLRMNLFRNSYRILRRILYHGMGWPRWSPKCQQWLYRQIKAAIRESWTDLLVLKRTELLNLQPRLLQMGQTMSTKAMLLQVLFMVTQKMRPSWAHLPSHWEEVASLSHLLHPSQLIICPSKALTRIKSYLQLLPGLNLFPRF